MVYKQPNEGKRPRGRPFAKGNKRGKIVSEVLDDSGRESSVEGGVVAPIPQLPASEILKKEKPVLAKMNEKLIDTTDQILKESMESTHEEAEAVEEKQEAKDLELIESLEFKNGLNTLTIRFSKKHNRMFRIQVFLNEDNEIRPVTYTGARTGYAFWNLLKGALKK